MTTHAVVKPDAIMAKDVDSLNRFAKAAYDLDNGNVVRLDAKTGTAGEPEVWAATKPLTSGTLLGGLWMVLEPELVTVVDAAGNKYRGLTDDPRNFYLPTGQVFTAFKPQVGDLITLTADAMSNAIAANTFVNAADNTSVLAWGASATANAFSMKLIATSYISIGSGVLGATGRVTAYQFVVVQN